MSPMIKTKGTQYNTRKILTVQIKITTINKTLFSLLAQQIIDIIDISIIVGEHWPSSKHCSSPTSYWTGLSSFVCSQI